jgi:N-acyl-D-amino-acid deacylase
MPTRQAAALSHREPIRPARRRAGAAPLWGCALVSVLAWVLAAATAEGASPPVEPPDSADVALSLDRAIRVVERGAANYPQHRNCFSCHHQTLPMLAMAERRDAGGPFDAARFRQQTEFTFESFRERIAPLREGRGIGGRAMTVAYGLWTLALAEHPPDETTAAMVTFLLKTQERDGHWAPPSNRPPLEESRISCTVLAMWYLDYYADGPQLAAADAAIKRATQWLVAAKAVSNEDRVFQLLGLRRSPQPDANDADPGQTQQQQRLAELRQALLAAQRPDGGWSQIDAMDSDAYATGQTLWALHELTRDERDADVHAALRRGLLFLLETQQPDGSWRVETRSRRVQVFFDNGDPHGKSQFISIAATSWAAAALARASDHAP